MFGNCETKVNDKKIVLREKRTKLVFNNLRQATHRKIKIDGCVIKNGPRCDYLLITDEKYEYYVELKGSKVRHGVKQLKQTIKHISSANNIGRTAIIICTKNPLNFTEIQNSKKIFKEKYKAVLLIKTKRYEIKI